MCVLKDVFDEHGMRATPTGQQRGSSVFFFLVAQKKEDLLHHFVDVTRWPLAHITGIRIGMCLCSKAASVCVDPAQGLRTVRLIVAAAAVHSSSVLAHRFVTHVQIESS